MAVNPKTDLNAWEDKTPILSEREKRDFTRARIESEEAGNPNFKPFRKERKIKFKAPTKEIEDRMKLLDHMGNPIKGYKWGKFDKKKGWCNIVKDTRKESTEPYKSNPSVFNYIKRIGS